MKRLRDRFARFAAVLVAGLLVASNAVASSVIVDYSGSSSPGVSLEITASGQFQTAGGANVVSHLNWADFLPVSDGLGHVRLSGVNLTGSALTIAPGVFTQSTSGGLLEIFDYNLSSLLLSVSFTSGQLLLSSVGTGSQFSIATATFGGLYSSALVANSAAHSLSLVGFSQVGIASNGGFLAASGFGNGLVSGKEVPEPMSLLLLGSGLLGAASLRRHKAL